MFNSLNASRALRQCTNRFIVQRKPCQATGIFPKWTSMINGPQCRAIQNGLRPKTASTLLQTKTIQQNITHRSVHQSSGSSDNGNVVLLVGLGALGLVSAVVLKMGIFSPDGSAPSPTKDVVTKIEVEPVSTTVEQEIEETVSVEDVPVITDDAPVPAEEAPIPAEEVPVVADNVPAEDAPVPAEEVPVPAEEVPVPEEELSSADQIASDNIAEPTKSEEENKEIELPFVMSEVDEETVLVEIPSEKAKTGNDAVSKESGVTDAVMAEVEAEVVETVPTGEEVKENVTTEAIDPVVSTDRVKVELTVPKIPENVPYLIIGAGTASHAACRAIRKNDPTAKILIVGDEEIMPYMRPPLSKELWFGDDEDTADTLYFKQWNGKQRSVFFEDDTFYTKPQLLPSKEEGGTAVLTGHKVTQVNPLDHTVHLKHGAVIKYEKLLIATGGRPKNHPLFENAEDTMKSKVTLFRTVADYRKLDKLVTSTDSVAIIGGGFLGSELACALASKSKKNEMKVSQIYHEDGNMGKILPKYLSQWTKEKVQKKGVDIHTNADITNVSISGDHVNLELSNGEQVSAGHVVVCVGLEPNTELASSAGLEVDPEHGGFRVNSELQARSDIWIAGDVCCFFDQKLGRRRVEHHDHAVVSGRLAGENMTGAKKSYVHQSMFWSDLGPDVGYEAIGIVDNSLDTVGVWAKATKSDSPKAVVEATGESVRSQSEQDAETGESVAPVETVETPDGTSEHSEKYGKGVVFYMKDNVVVGVLLWNIFNRMPVARKILKDGARQTDLKELAKLFNIHD